MDREKARLALENARRARLGRLVGTSRDARAAIADLVEADLLRGMADLLDEEARLLERQTQRIVARDTRRRALDCRREADRLVRTAHEKLAAAFHDCDAERLVTIAAGIAGARQAADARNVANELDQGADRIGRQASAYLWDLLEQTCARREIPFPTDLRERFHNRLADARSRAGEELAARRAEELRERAARLSLDASTLDKPAIYDRIVSIGARLKLLEEDRERRGLRTDVPFARLDPEGKLIRQAFRLLSDVSRTFKPGWTEVLDPEARGRDWERMAREAEEHLQFRARAREEELRKARDQQIEEARRQWREMVQGLAFQEALDRLRALLDRDGEDGVFREAARAEAAVACRLAEGEEEQLARVAEVLGSHLDLVATGRAFRALRRRLGIQAPAEAEEETPATGDLADEVAEEAANEAVLPWPDWVLERHGAGTGERVLLVGGLPNDRRLDMLQQFFGWADANWVESYRDHSADFGALKKQVRAGRWDRVVALTRFCGHDVTQALSAATTKAKVPFLRHPRSPTIPALAATLYGAGPRR